MRARLSFFACPEGGIWLLALVAVGLVTGACSVGSPGHSRQTPRPVVVNESYRSPLFAGDNIDSLAVWAPGGWLLASAKSTDAVLVLRASDGTLVRRIGGPGQAPGQLRRPNGLSVVDDLLLVVERDNRRVQVFKLPELLPLGLVGEGILRYPYGIAAYTSSRGRCEVYVTDSYQRPDEAVPPAEELGERVRHFGVELTSDGLRASLVRSFGETSGDGMLHVVESVAVDPTHNRLLLADEDAGQRDIKVYSLDGRFSGERMGRGLFEAEPEGIALVPAGSGGYWITTDQQKSLTVFHVFDRRSLRLLGSFTGTKAANTDGIVTATGSVAGFSRGVLFAVDDDEAVVAFSWPAITRALRLPRRAAS